MKTKRVCILGGSGFVGRHLCAELARRHFRIRVLTRRTARCRHLLVFPTIELVETDVHYASRLNVHFRDCDAVVNLVGILNEGSGGNQRFDEAHALLPAKVSEACQFNGIKRILHMSALGVDPQGPSNYLRTKAAGEEAAHAAELEGTAVTSFRPSVIFGPDDDFFNRFASLLALSPLVFPLACPNSRLAPVYVEDVCRAFVDSLGEKATFGKRLELCGPRSYTLKELVEYTAGVLGLRRKVIGLNDGLSRLQARVLEVLPGKPFSYDNYLSLGKDSVCSRNGFEQLGILPMAVEAIVPGYLGNQNRSARYQNFRTTAGRG
jgi:NADH dehydrogenase